MPFLRSPNTKKSLRSSFCRLTKMNLHLQLMSTEHQMAKLSKGDQNWLANKLIKNEAVRDIRPMVISSGESISEDPRVERLWEAVHKDYDGSVLGTKVMPEPPSEARRKFPM